MKRHSILISSALRAFTLTIAVGLCIGVSAGNLHAQIAVTDAASLTNNKISHAENITKWVENISQLKTQIAHLKEQIAIQNELRNWTGDPAKAAPLLGLDGLTRNELTRLYGENRETITHFTDSLAALKREDSGTFQALDLRDMDGHEIQPDASLYRRHSVLQARQDNARKVADETRKREQSLQSDIAQTTADLRSAATDAEVQKLNAKLQVLNGQLAATETTRKREVDEVELQKIANETQHEVEQAAAAELRAKDDHLANKRATEIMRTLIPRPSAGDSSSSSR
jgi:hypothetical protein